MSENGKERRPGGSYSFRLDASPEADPDEDFTEGPRVSFVIAGACVLLALGIVVALWVVGGDEQRPPRTAPGGATQPAPRGDTQPAPAPTAEEKPPEGDPPKDPAGD